MKVDLSLTVKEARLLQVAVEQEIRKGSSTFLSGRDVMSLARIRDSLSLMIAQETAAERMGLR